MKLEKILTLGFCVFVFLSANKFYYLHFKMEEKSSLEEKPKKRLTASGEEIPWPFAIEGETYVVKKGDNLWKIAEMYAEELYYNRKILGILKKDVEKIWVKIYQDNKEKCKNNGNLIYPGTELKISLSPSELNLDMYLSE